MQGVMDFAHNVSVLMTALRAHKESVETVVNQLRSQGVKGRKGDEEHCPLANYFRESLKLNDEDYVVNITGDDMYISKKVYDPDYEEWDTEMLYSVTLPDALCQFVTNFDDGKYPDLELAAK